MNNYKLSEVLKFQNGKSIKPGGEGKYPVYGSNGLIGGSDDFKHKSGIILGRVGAYCGAVMKSEKPFWASDNTIVAQPIIKMVEMDYMYYHLKQMNLNRYAGGSAQPLLTQTVLKQVETKIPDQKTQQKIASILSAFDELIENNTRRIAILEETARLIYREWFVHYRYPGHENDRLEDSGTDLGDVPEGWEVNKLQDVADLNPENISKDYKGEIEYINISGVDTGSINETEIHEIDEAPGRAKRKVNHGDIIWSSVRPNLKSYALIMNPKPNWIASTGFVVIRPKKLPSSFLYNFVTTDYFIEYLINHARGSAYPAVNVSDFKNAKIVVPPDDLVKKYDELVWTNFQQFDRLERKNKKLKETRDLLLPKLISGIIEIEKFKR